MLIYILEGGPWGELQELCLFYLCLSYFINYLQKEGCRWYWDDSENFGNGLQWTICIYIYICNGCKWYCDCNGQFQYSYAQYITSNIPVTIICIPGAWKLAQLGYPICNSILWSKELFLTQEPYFWKGPCIEPFRVEHLYDTGLYTFIQVKLGKHPHIVLFHCHSPWHSLVWPQDCFWLLMEIWKC